MEGLRSGSADMRGVSSATEAASRVLVGNIFAMLAVSSWSIRELDDPSDTYTASHLFNLFLWLDVNSHSCRRCRQLHALLDR
jgi:hypothetical protein